MTDDILCEAPGPGGLTCTLPYGHKPEAHAFAVELTPDLGELIEGIMTQTEAARVAYEKARRHERIVFYIWGGLCVVYIVLIVSEVFQ